MRDFEEELRRALARREPPQDFALRVLAMAGSQSKLTALAQLRLWFCRVPMWQFAPALAALLVMSGGAIYQQHERVAHGQQAKQKLLTAMRIAGSKLHHAQDRVFAIERREMMQ
ncbi:MAG: hypothetical protein JO097_10770 [Acidobacteriaceae bacterium]|nr:hypothetical protein [Acidobacteriaceae bacterium]MBV9293974.1 hypothetical protein [Acidobacteriaceae bacterium]